MVQQRAQEPGFEWEWVEAEAEALLQERRQERALGIHKLGEDIGDHIEGL